MSAALPIEKTLDAIASDWVAIVGLFALVGAMIYVGRELRRTRELVEPIARSPLLRAAAGIGT